MAILYGERAALRLARPVRVLARLLAPLLTLEEKAARSLTSPLGEEITPPPNGPADGLGIDGDEETLDEHEARMIRGVVDLDRTIAREVMVPRVDMVTVQLGVPMADVVRTMMESGHSRIPVIRGNVDNIEGIVHSREILGLLSDGNGGPSTLTKDIVRQPLFIPEYKTLEELLTEFQETQRHIAIVVDEYGGVSGLVTIEDLLEEIVGEITDEFDIEEPGVEWVGEDEFMFDAGIGIDESWRDTLDRARGRWLRHPGRVRVSASRQNSQDRRLRHSRRAEDRGILDGGPPGQATPHHEGPPVRQIAIVSFGSRPHGSRLPPSRSGRG